jgi:hypothetical protein
MSMDAGPYAAGLGRNFVCSVYSLIGLLSPVFDGNRQLFGSSLFVHKNPCFIITIVY